MMDWVYLATGATGALTLVFVFRQALGVLLGGPSTQVWFTPTDKALDALLAAVRSARKEILVQASAFRSPELAQALVDAKLRGVTVEVLLTPGQETDPTSVLQFLLDQGLAPLIDHDHAATLAQVIMIDERIVLTGTTPFAAPSDGDSGQLLALRDQPGLAAAFRRQFFLHREHGRPPQLKQSPTTTSSPTPPMSETLARLLPGLRGVNLPTEAELQEQEQAEQKQAQRKKAA